MYPPGQEQRVSMEMKDVQPNHPIILLQEKDA